MFHFSYKHNLDVECNSVLLSAPKVTVVGTNIKVRIYCTMPNVSRFIYYLNGSSSGVAVQGTKSGNYIDATIPFSSMNLNVGSNTIKIGVDGIGVQSNATITVLAQDIGGATVSFPNYTFNGSAILAEPIVSYGSRLTKNVDYIIKSYANNINAGNTASVTIEGRGKYKGVKTINFTINPAGGIEAGWIGEIPSQTYTGSALTPDISFIKYNNIDLIKNQDYTVTYSNNINAGTARATFTGKGNYCGEFSKDFTINKANGFVNLNSTVFDKIWGDGEFVLSNKIASSHSLAVISYQSSNNAIIAISGAKASVKGVGTAKITVTASETTNYKSATATFDIKVTSRSLTFNGTENGGSSNQTINAEYGKNVSFPQIAKAGWNLVGWNTNKDATTGLASYQMPNSNATLYAIYSKVLTLNYYNLAVSGKQTLTTTIFNKATSGTVTIVKMGTPKEGWISDGWSNITSANDSRIDTNTEAHSVTLTSNNPTQTWYASYRKVITVSYNTITNGGTANSLTSTGLAYYNVGDTATPNISYPTLTLKGIDNTKANWTGLGWSESGNPNQCINTYQNLSVDKTVIAQYKRDLKLILNIDGTLTNLTATIYNKETSKEVIMPEMTSLSSWTAMGWKKDNTATATVIFDNNTKLHTINLTEALTGQTLYALYSRKLKVNFNTNGGTPAISQMIKTQYKNVKNYSDGSFTLPKASVKDYNIFKTWQIVETKADLNAESVFTFDGANILTEVTATANFVKAEAKIDAKLYETFEEAVLNAKAEDTIEVLIDVNIGATINIDKNLIIKSFNGVFAIKREAGFSDMFKVTTSTLTLENIKLDGGAVWGEKLNDSIFRHNKGVVATGSIINIISGGVVLNSGATLQNNDNKGKNGGAVDVKAGATLIVNANAEISNVSSENGGAVYLGGTAEVNGGLFDLNIATNGGDFYIAESGTLNLISGTMQNQRGTNGGSIYLAGKLNFNPSMTIKNDIYYASKNLVTLSRKIENSDNSFTFTFPSNSALDTKIIEASGQVAGNEGLLLKPHFKVSNAGWTFGYKGIDSIDEKRYDEYSLYLMKSQSVSAITEISNNPKTYASIQGAVDALVTAGGTGTIYIVSHDHKGDDTKDKNFVEVFKTIKIPSTSDITFKSALRTVDKDLNGAYTQVSYSEILDNLTYQFTTIKRGEGMTKAMIEVEKGGALSLGNITIDGGAVWGANNQIEITSIALPYDVKTNNTGLYANAPIIVASGDVVLNANATLQNNENRYSIFGSEQYGGAIRVSGIGASLIMNDGKIANCYAREGGAIMNVTKYASVTGENPGSTVEIKGGTISGSASQTKGNVIQTIYGNAKTTISGGTFENNGAIFTKANDDSTHGDFTVEEGGSLIITGGKITSTKKAVYLYNDYCNNYSGYFEGLHVAILNITGGTIVGDIYLEASGNASTSSKAIPGDGQTASCNESRQYDTFITSKQSIAGTYNVSLSKDWVIGGVIIKDNIANFTVQNLAKDKWAFKSAPNTILGGMQIKDIKFDDKNIVTVVGDFIGDATKFSVTVANVGTTRTVVDNIFTAVTKSAIEAGKQTITLSYTDGAKTLTAKMIITVPEVDGGGNKTGKVEYEKSITDVIYYSTNDTLSDWRVFDDSTATIGIKEVPNDAYIDAEGYVHFKLVETDDKGVKTEYQYKVYVGKRAVIDPGIDIGQIPNISEIIIKDTFIRIPTLIGYEYLVIDENGKYVEWTTSATPSTTVNDWFKGTGNIVEIRDLSSGKTYTILARKSGTGTELPGSILTQPEPPTFITKTIEELKEKGKGEIDKETGEAKKVIDSLIDLVIPEPGDAKKKIDELVAQSKKNIDTTTDPDEIDRIVKQLIDDITKEVDKTKDLNTKHVEDKKKEIKGKIDRETGIAIGEINKLINLTEEEKNKAIKEINDKATKTKENIEKVTTIKEIEDLDKVLVGETKDIVDKAKVVEEINKKQKEDEALIDDLDNLTEQEKTAKKDEIKTEVDKAKKEIDLPTTDPNTAITIKTKLDIDTNAIVDKAKDLDAKNLKDAKDKAIIDVNDKKDKLIKEINELKNLIGTEKEVAIKSIEDKTTALITDIKDDLLIIDVNTKKDALIKEIGEIGKATKDLDAGNLAKAKADAEKEITAEKVRLIGEINNLKNLIGTEKEVAIKSIEDKTTALITDIKDDLLITEVNTKKDALIKEIGEIGKTTKQLDADNLTKAKEEAILKINTEKDRIIGEINNLGNLIGSEKDDAINKIKNDTTTAITEINNVSTIIDVNTKKDAIITAIGEIGKATKDLDAKNLKDAKDKAIKEVTAEKEKAIKVIDGLTNLTEKDKTDAKKLVDDEAKRTIQNIEEATLITAVDTLKTDSIAEIEILTKDATAKDVQRLIEKKINDFTNTYNYLKDSGKYSEKGLAELQNAFDKGVNDITAEMTLSTVEKAFDDSITALKEVKVMSIGSGEVVPEGEGGKPNDDVDYEDDKTTNDVWGNISNDDGMDSEVKLVINEKPTNKEEKKDATNKLNKYGIIASDTAVIITDETAKDIIKGKELKRIIDIKLVKSSASGDVEVDKSEIVGTYTIKLLIPKNMRDMVNLQIVYARDDGAIEVFDTTREGNYLIFKTNHFSDYMVLGEPVINLTWLIVVLGAGALAEIFYLLFGGKKRKDDDDENGDDGKKLSEDDDNKKNSKEVKI